MALELFLHAFIALLVIVNPLGVSAVFVGLMGHSEPAEIRATARKAVLVALGALLFFAFLGEPLMQKLGIGIPSFRVAGGLLLFVIAFRMLFGENRPEGGGNDRAFADRADVAVFPLGIPLITGPGCMTLSILLMSQTQSNFDVLIVSVAILLVMGLTYVALMGSRMLYRIIGASGNNIIARVMGMILAARSVQFVVDGLQGMHFNFVG